MTRTLKIALVALVVSLPLLMAPTGGFPSRPRFAAVGVNVAAPATAGNLTAGGTITGATVNATTALQLNGVALAPDELQCPSTGGCDISGLAVNQSAFLYKGSATARNSVTAQTMDPDLVWTVNAAHNYSVEFCMSWSLTTTNTQGIRLEWGQSSGSGSGTLMGQHNGAGAVAGLALLGDVVSGAITGGVIGNTLSYCGAGHFNPNATTWGILWAQGVSEVNNTTMLGGQTTWFRIRRQS